MMQRGGWTLDC